MIETTLRVAGSNLLESLPKSGTQLYPEGVISLSQGFLITSMLLSAILVFVIERKLLQPAAWLMVAALLSSVGLIHAYTLTPGGVQNSFGFWQAPAFTLSYASVAFMLLGWHFCKQKGTD